MMEEEEGQDILQPLGLNRDQTDSGTQPEGQVPEMSQKTLQFEVIQLAFPGQEAGG